MIEIFWGGDEDNTQTEQKNIYQKPSTWTPSNGRDQTFDCYFSIVERAILEEAPNNNHLRSNVMKEERNAINALKQDRNIVIFQADKGAAVVVQNCWELYLNEAYKQLKGRDQNNDEVYHRVPIDPTNDFVHKVKDAVHDALAKDVIDQDTANYLISTLFWKSTNRNVRHHQYL